MCDYRETGPIVICASCLEQRRLRRDAEETARAMTRLAEALELITAQQRAEIYDLEQRLTPKGKPAWLVDDNAAVTS